VSRYFAAARRGGAGHTQITDNRESDQKCTNTCAEPCVHHSMPIATKNTPDTGVCALRTAEASPRVPSQTQIHATLQDPAHERDHAVR